MSHHSLGVSVPDRHFSRVRYAHVGDLFAIKLLVLIEDCDTVNAIAPLLSSAEQIMRTLGGEKAMLIFPI